MGDFTDISAFNSQNQPGTHSTLYYWPLDDVATFPAYSSGTDLADEVKITADFTFKTGKKMLALAIQPETGDVQYAPSGEQGSRFIEASLAFTLPGATAERLAFINKWGHTQMQCGIKDNTGVMHLIGNEHHPAFLDTGEGGTGGDANQMVLTVKATQEKPQIYEGTIVTTPTA